MIIVNSPWSWQSIMIMFQNHRDQKRETSWSWRLVFKHDHKTEQAFAVIIIWSCGVLCLTNLYFGFRDCWSLSRRLAQMIMLGISSQFRSMIPSRGDRKQKQDWRVEMEVVSQRDHGLESWLNHGTYETCLCRVHDSSCLLWSLCNQRDYGRVQGKWSGYEINAQSLCPIRTPIEVIESSIMIVYL